MDFNSRKGPFAFLSGVILQKEHVLLILSYHSIFYLKSLVDFKSFLRRVPNVLISS
jgi:hypothetical protein